MRGGKKIPAHNDIIPHSGLVMETPLPAMFRTLHADNDQALEIIRNVMYHFKPANKDNDAIARALTCSTKAIACMIHIKICGAALVSFYEKKVGTLVLNDANIQSFLACVIVETLVRELKDDELLQACRQRASEMRASMVDLRKMATHIAETLVGFSDIDPRMQNNDPEARIEWISSQSCLLTYLLLGDPAAIALLKKNNTDSISKEDEDTDLMRIVLAETSMEQITAWNRAFHLDPSPRDPVHA